MLEPPASDWPSLAEILEVLSLMGGYNTTLAMLGVTLLGAAAGIVGTFAVLRKRALVGDALSHAALPGIALAFIVATALGGEGRSLPVLLGGAALSGILGVVTIQAIARHTRLPEDAAIGAVLSVFFGIGYVLLSVIQNLATGDQGGISHFILGQTAAMGLGDAALIAVVALAATLTALALFKEFRAVCFDTDYAQSQGWPVTSIDLAIMALLVAVTVIGLRAVGLILIIALIIIPAAAARFWTERLAIMVLIAAGFGAASGYLGAAASALLPDFPAGAVIVLTAGILFVLSLFLAPRRGVLASLARHLVLRLDVACQHVLRALFEVAEAEPARHGGLVPVAELAPLRRWPVLWCRMILWWLARRGRLERIGHAVRLTDLGHREALRVTRNHRLWEQFLVAYAELAPSHVDRSADLVEHVLSPDMVAELERALTAAGRLPRFVGLPPSPHPLGHAHT